MNGHRVIAQQVVGTILAVIVLSIAGWVADGIKDDISHLNDHHHPVVPVFVPRPEPR